MKIFSQQPKLTRKDKLRLSPFLSNYNKLVKCVAYDMFTQADLKMLVLLELKGKQRQDFFRFLIGKIQTKQREEIKTKIDQCLKEN